MFIKGCKADSKHR